MFIWTHIPIILSSDLCHGVVYALMLVLVHSLDDDDAIFYTCQTRTGFAILCKQFSTKTKIHVVSSPFFIH
ncbi:AAEL017528-PA [Aedes aegypti]|uniref:AAEL017528-PA n=1 Tax=Aedes aegypti TaxID=7159 RepID=J9HTR9_AEDAE|nr:AAEL017528-PA [Aedes aegypti]